ncbi:hypothetical protein [Rhizobium laguerreae]|uniref:hypothetical protein n=1 Tax=Rhizobium laguerreae TaxID=1076926 RepID=UPI001C8FFF04|nr:hypothetical protein [Rhizobium laguerreae]MBY3220952.1 hypothetical protein [Rhizobium laguerreae]
MSRRQPRKPAPHLLPRPAKNPRRDTSDKTAAWAEQGYVVYIADQLAQDGFFKLDLGILKMRSEIAGEVCDYGAHWGPKVVAETRLNLKKALRYFALFLDAMEETFDRRIMTLDGLSADVVELFRLWLIGKLDMNPPAASLTDRLSEHTAGNIYSRVRQAFEWCLKRSDRRGARKPSPFKRNAYPRSAKGIKHRAPLDAATLGKIRKACFADLDETFTLLRHGEKVLASNTLVSLDDFTSALKYNDLDSAIALYAMLEDKGVSKKALRDNYPTLARRLRSYILVDIIKHLHFTAETLLPIVILTVMEAFYNSQTAHDANWNDVIISDLANGGIKLSPNKGRGEFRQPRSFSKSSSHRYEPPELIALLHHYSRRTAGFIASHLAGNLFICASETYRSYSHIKTRGGAPLRRFREKHKLPPFTMAQFRVTGSDVVAEITGGDIAAQAHVLGHVTHATTRDSYVTEGQKARYAENLAINMGYIQRWIDTAGKSDVRGLALSETGRTAVTPGFLCLDPYNSPLLGQRSGRICNAYGRCPACPLCAVNRSDPKAFFRLVQLRELLRDLRRTCDGQRWITHWQPQLLELENYFLPQFSISVVDAAAKLTLSPLPKLD